MTKKKTLQARPGAQGASKKTHSRSKKTGDPAKAASQTHQPYEQDKAPYWSVQWHGRSALDEEVTCHKRGVPPERAGRSLAASTARTSGAGRVTGYAFAFFLPFCALVAVVPKENATPAKG
jgi:hypothetical protein